MRGLSIRSRPRPKPSTAKPRRVGLGGAVPAEAEGPSGLDESDLSDDEGGGESSSQHGWTHGSALATKATTVVVVLGLLTGPAALWLELGGSELPAATEAVVGQDPDLSARQAAAEDLAVQWVRAWLTTGEEDVEHLARFYAGDLVLPEEPASVHRVDVLGAVASAPGVWTVTVGAEVELDAGLVRRYFQVPVSVDGGAGTAAARVMTPPAVVSGPGRSAPARAVSYGTVLPRGSAPASAAEAFLRAFLTGDGELSRLTVPGTTWEALSAPYADLEVLAIGAMGSASAAAYDDPQDGDQVRVRVDLVLFESTGEDAADEAQGDAAGDTDQATTTKSPTAVAEEGRGIQSEYHLSLTARAGRWEVAAIDPGPIADIPVSEGEGSDVATRDR